MAESSEIQYHEDTCVICVDPEVDEKLVRVRKGIETLIEYSQKRNRITLYEYLCRQNSELQPKKVFVHESCRRDFTNYLRLPDSENINLTNETFASKTRSSSNQFNWKEHCFYCGNEAHEDSRHPDRKTIYRALTLPCRDKVLKICNEKIEKFEDQWAQDVKKRLLSCIDFVHAEARYHDRCRSLFNITDMTPQKGKKQGRKADSEAQYYYEQACEYLEYEAEIITVQDLHRKMVEFAEGDKEKVYTAKWLKIKLKKKYGEYLYFVQKPGKVDLISFKDMASYIIDDKWYTDKKSNMQDETERIIVAAAKLIKSEIRQATYVTEMYPTINHVKQDDLSSLPRSLQILMKSLVSSKLKQASIGQCLLKAAKPNSTILPLQFGLAVEMENVFGSKWLVNELSRLGFSMSYTEVTKYKQSVIKNTNVDEVLSHVVNGSFTQFVADNVDHNIRTLDGQGTFHGMGMIAISSNAEQEIVTQDQPVARPKKLFKSKEVISGKGIPIKWYDTDMSKGLRSVIFQPVDELLVNRLVCPSSTSVDLLWHSAAFFKVQNRPRPNWSGFMQTVSSGIYPPRSTITMLPIIDLNPSDYSCIYSVLVYIVDQCRNLDIEVPCITFDQPLYFKAMEIITAKSMKIVCRLGGFHTLMSFLGSIGDLMEGSGLEEALQRVYGKNAVDHMMTGKAIARALRGHTLVDAALHMRLMEDMFPEGITQPDSENNTVTRSSSIDDTDINSDAEDASDDHETQIKSCTCLLKGTDVDELQDLCNKLMVEKVDDVLKQAQPLVKLQHALESKRAHLRATSRTAKLWYMYCNYIAIVKQFIQAERTSDWEMHLTATAKMLNLFAATGHIHYTKSARLYLQEMNKLPKTHPWLYEQLALKRLFTVRRSDRFWAGLWTDLSIEQVLMKSLKNRGGLTRGRGMTESVRTLWIYSMHKCAAVHNAMSSVTGLSHRTSEQHVEMGSSRCQRDVQDLQKIFKWFCQHDPFDVHETQLKSLSTGLTATTNDGINCDNVEVVGNRIQVRLDGISVADASIKRSDKVKSLSSLKKGVIIGQQTVYVDPLVLFTRLVMLLERSEDMSSYFQYELTPVPTSLFKENLMRKPNKSALANYLIASVDTRKRKISDLTSKSGKKFAWRKEHTNICTCRRNGLKCVTACGDCRGYECANAEDDHDIDDLQDDADDLQDDGNVFERLFDV